MDIRSSYAIKLGVLLDDKFAEPIQEGLTSGRPPMPEEDRIEDVCYNRVIPTDDIEFVVMGQSETHDGPPKQHFDYILDAVDAALLLAADPREFQVFLGFSISCNEDEWVEVKHAAIHTATSDADRD